MSGCPIALTCFNVETGSDLVSKLLTFSKLTQFVPEIVAEGILILNPMHLFVTENAASLVLGFAAVMSLWKLATSSKQQDLSGLFGFMLLVSLLQTLLYKQQYSSAEIPSGNLEFSSLLAAQGPMLAWKASVAASELLIPSKEIFERKADVFAAVAGTYLSALRGQDVLVAYQRYLHSCSNVPQQVEGKIDGLPRDHVGWKSVGLNHGTRLGLRDELLKIGATNGNASSLFAGSTLADAYNLYQRLRADEGPRMEAIRALKIHSTRIGSGKFATIPYKILSPYQWGKFITDSAEFAHKKPLINQLDKTPYDSITHEDSQYFIESGTLQHPVQYLNDSIPKIDTRFYAETCHELFYIVDENLYNYYLAVQEIVGPSAIVAGTPGDDDRAISVFAAQRNLHLTLSRAFDTNGESLTSIIPTSQGSIHQRYINEAHANFSAAYTQVTSTIDTWALRYGFLSFVALCSFAYIALYLMGPLFLLCAVFIGWDMLLMYFKFYVVVTAAWIINSVMLIACAELIGSLSIMMSDIDYGSTGGSLSSSILFTGAIGTMFISVCVIEFGLAYLIIKQDVAGFRGPAAGPFSSGPVHAVIGLAATASMMAFRAGGKRGQSHTTSDNGTGASRQQSQNPVNNTPTNTIHTNNSHETNTEASSTRPPHPKFTDKPGPPAPTTYDKIGEKYMADIQAQSKKNKENANDNDE